MRNGGIFHLRINPHGLEAHARMLVANAGGSVKLRGAQPIVPVREHTHGRSAHTGVIGLEGKHQQ